MLRLLIWQWFWFNWYLIVRNMIDFNCIFWGKKKIKRQMKGITFYKILKTKYWKCWHKGIWCSCTVLHVAFDNCECIHCIILSVISRPYISYFICSRRHCQMLLKYIRKCRGAIFSQDFRCTFLTFDTTVNIHGSLVTEYLTVANFVSGFTVSINK